jgi:hypothetical protein
VQFNLRRQRKFEIAFNSNKHSCRRRNCQPNSTCRLRFMTKHIYLWWVEEEQQGNESGLPIEASTALKTHTIALHSLNKTSATTAAGGLVYTTELELWNPRKHQDCNKLWWCGDGYKLQHVEVCTALLLFFLER